MIYSLADPELAGWLLGGLSFIECEIEQTAQKRDAVEAVRAIWSAET